MARSRLETQRTHDPTVLRAIAHPMRNRILNEMSATGPTRAADIAAGPRHPGQPGQLPPASAGQVRPGRGGRRRRPRQARPGLEAGRRGRHQPDHAGLRGLSGRQGSGHGVPPQRLGLGAHDRRRGVLARPRGRHDADDHRAVDPADQGRGRGAGRASSTRSCRSGRRRTAVATTRGVPISTSRSSSRTPTSLSWCCGAICAEMTGCADSDLSFRRNCASWAIRRSGAWCGRRR